MATNRPRTRAAKAADNAEELEAVQAAESSLNNEGLQIDAALHELASEACYQVKSAVCDVARSVQRNPLTAVATAGLVGMVVGLLMRRD